MSLGAQTGRSKDGIRCPECGQRVPSRDHLADHLTDEHEAFNWIFQGRPINHA